MRFEAEVQAFAKAMLDTLNNTQNVNKPSDLQWISLQVLFQKYLEEKFEFEDEITAQDVSGAPAEAIDLANCLMMIWTKIEGEKIEK